VLNEGILIGGASIPALQFLIIFVTLVLLVLLVLFLRRTAWGVQMRAAAEDFKMARMLGVRANFVISLAFVLSGMLAAAVSLLFEVQSGILMFRMGTPLMVFAFIATVIGGMGSLVGAVVGGFTVGIMSSILQAALPSEVRGYRDAFVFGLVILILLARPQGMVLSRAARERV
jgi:branched-chain amino acid transport system permease protein